MSETIILVPGIGLGGFEFLMLARQLRKQQYDVKIFWKNPWRVSLSSSAKALHDFLSKQPTSHLVAHSFGGVVVLKMLQDYPQLAVGNVVMLGSPLAGCLAAQRVLKIPFGRWLLGEALASICIEPHLVIPQGLKVGSIAGRLNFLLGFILCPQKMNDTLICVEETQLPYLSDHCILNVTHSSLLISKQVVTQIVHFIRHAMFSISREGSK